MNKIKLPEYLNELINKIWNESKPESIFLYGSMARDDFEKDSDYEIGIIYQQDKRWTRQQLKDINTYENVKIYPFVAEELANGEIDTPFPKSIYLHTLLNSQVIRGGELSNYIHTKTIQKSDLYESVGFSLGRAYSAVVSSRQEDWVAVRDGFTKAVFYGLQVLVFIKTNQLIFSYKKLVDLSKPYIDPEYTELVTHASEVRKGESAINPNMLYKSISFLNKAVLISLKN
jgi:predicted nucleotidyltransferase